MPKAILKLMRPAHWAKNVFVLAPVIFAHRLTDPDSLRRAALAFVVFCFASSAVYVFNDIRDRDEDRRHPLKKHRPIAAGVISPAMALALGVVLAGLALAGTLLLASGLLAAVLILYLASNLVYSAWLKHIVILDVMIVAMGFVLRVLGGALAIEVDVSSWLLLCTIFVALFLVFSKRRHELLLLDKQASGQRPVLSHYSPAFLDQMINVVTASSVLAYALYCVAPDTVERFGSENLVYTVPFVLFGIFRYLYLVYQAPSRRNPTEAIVRDAPSLVNVLLWGLAVVWIIYGAELVV